MCQFLARVASQLVENLHSFLSRSFVDKVVQFLDRINSLLVLGDDGDAKELENGGTSQVLMLLLLLFANVGGRI